ncbi:MAG: ATP-binding protein, partial [Oceanidesulfovibrio sp.]
VLSALVFLTHLFRVRHFRRPLNILRQGIESLRTGNLEHRIDLKRDDEWSLMEDAINHMAYELSRSYKALEDSTYFYRGLFELGLIGMAVMDDTGTRWLEVNDRFCELLRYPRETIMATQWSEIIHPEDHGLDQVRFDAMLNGETDGYALDVRFLRGDGSTAYTMLSVKCARDESGSIKAIYVLLNDISQRVLAQEQLDIVNKNLEQLVEERSGSLLEKTEELEAANRRLRELDELKSDFLSSISHELRTPLTSILGFAKLVNRELARLNATDISEQDDFQSRIERMHSNLEIIGREGERLTRLINEILDLSKIESGQVEWRDLICSCRTLAHQALEAVEPQFEQKPEIELVVDIDEEDASMRVDPDRYLQICINLLNNAIKFTPSGRIIITAAPTQNGYYRFSVQDTGIGIPPDDLERIFDKFLQAPTDDTLRDKPVGTGLGLSICNQIVSHYCGRIWVESTPSMGSTFTFELPLLAARDSEKPEQA